MTGERYVKNYVFSRDRGSLVKRRVVLEGGGELFISLL